MIDQILTGTELLDASLLVEQAACFARMFTKLNEPRTMHDAQVHRYGPMFIEEVRKWLETEGRKQIAKGQ